MYWVRSLPGTCQFHSLLVADSSDRPSMPSETSTTCSSRSTALMTLVLLDSVSTSTGSRTCQMNTAAAATAAMRMTAIRVESSFFMMTILGRLCGR